MRLNYLLHSLAYVVEKHRASNKRLEQNRNRHFVRNEKQIQTVEVDKINMLEDVLMESKSETEQKLPVLRKRLHRLAKDNANKIITSTSSSGISNIKKKKKDESVHEQLIKAGLLVNSQNTLMQVFVAILTRLLYNRTPLHKVFTGYYTMLLSNQGRKIIDQENENLQRKKKFTLLLRCGINYTVACVKEIDREIKEKATSKLHVRSAKIKRVNSSKQKNCNALQRLLYDYTIVFNKTFTPSLRTAYNKNAFVQLITIISYYSTHFNKHFSQFYNDYLITPPTLLTKVHPYFTTMEIVPETHIIYWMMDWILYTVLNDNLLDLKITIENLAPNGILVKGLIYAFTTMLNKQERFIMLKNGGFLENWADNLSSALIEQLKNFCLYSAINDLKEALNAVEWKGIEETAYENILSVKDNKKEKENREQVQLAVIRITLYFFDITKSFFYEKTI